MKHVPEKYLKPQHLREALKNIRRCLASGLTIEQMAQEIIETYKGAYPLTRVGLGLLLTCVYDFSQTDRETVKRCAEKFKSFLPSDLNPQRPISYEVYRKFFKIAKKVQWLEEYTEKVFNWEGIEQDPKYYALWMVMYHSVRDHLITLCKDAGLFCFVDENMTVNLFVVETNDSILTIDEEPYGKDDPPYYRGLDDYIISPVYKVKVANKILEYCLQRIGFPAVEIKLHVVYNCLQEHFTNKEDYMEGGKYADKWDGVHIFEYLDHNEYMFPYPETCIFHEHKDETDSLMLSALSSSLSATAMLFSELHRTERLIHHSPLKLRNLAKRLDIFM